MTKMYDPKKDPTIPTRKRGWRGGDHHHTSAEKKRYGASTGSFNIANLERDAEIIERKIRGQSSWEIAREMGITYAVVHGALQRRTRNTIHPLVEELRDIQNEQIDRLFQVWFPKALEGSGPATDKVLKLWERQAKLNGLDVNPGINVDARQINISIEGSPEQILALASARTSEEIEELGGEIEIRTRNGRPIAQTVIEQEPEED